MSRTNNLLGNRYSSSKIAAMRDEVLSMQNRLEAETERGRTRVGEARIGHFEIFFDCRRDDFLAKNEFSHGALIKHEQREYTFRRDNDSTEAIVERTSDMYEFDEIDEDNIWLLRQIFAAGSTTRKPDCDMSQRNLIQIVSRKIAKTSVL